MVIFRAYYKEFAEMFMQFIKRVGRLDHHTPRISPAFVHVPVDKIGLMLELKYIWCNYRKRFLAPAPVKRVKNRVHLFSLLYSIAHAGGIKQYVGDLAEHAVLFGKS